MIIIFFRLFLIMILSLLPYEVFAKNALVMHERHLMEFSAPPPVENYARNAKGTFLGHIFDGLEQQAGKRKDWFNLSYEDKAEGVASDKAYQIFGEPKGKEVIVAVIDGGVDVTHEDLVGKIWVNKNEIPNDGIDNDENGYVDDIFGWNFIGGKNGMMTIEDNDQNFDNGFKYIPGNPDWQVLDDTLEVTREYKRLTALAAQRELTNEEKQYFARVTERFNERSPSDNPKYYDLKVDTRRDIVGDNDADWNQRYYGNNDVVGPDASHGTHVAGIIAANRKNNIGTNGVAIKVKIMSIRVVPDGDERDKDVANAIYYAVNNGAQVINMSFGKGFSFGKSIVDKAVLFAESKGVLIAHAAGNEANNNDVNEGYPNRRVSADLNTDEKEFSNWVEVGASANSQSNIVASFSNFGMKTVDIFAPGLNIYSTVPGSSKYEEYSGTSMASPVVAGVMASLLSYASAASPFKLKQAMLDSARLYAGLQVFHAGRKREFSELSITGGIVDLYKSASTLGLEQENSRYISDASMESAKPIGRKIPEFNWHKRNYDLVSH